MSRRRTHTILLMALPLLGAFCAARAPSLREPVDLPLDDIDVVATDGGAGEVQVDARGQESGDVGAAGTAPLEAADGGESDAAGHRGAAGAGEAAAPDASGAADAAHATAGEVAADGAGAGTSEARGEGSGAGEQDERLGIDLRGN